MNKWLKYFKAAWFLIGIGAGSIFWLFATFATQSQAIDIKVQAREYTDQKFSELKVPIDYIKKSVDRIEDRQLNGGK